MKVVARHLLLLLGMALPGPPAHAEGAALGRLFFTAEQRAELDRRRLNATNAEPEDNRLTLNGEIRHNNRRQQWINGQPAESEADALPALAVGDSYQRRTGQRRSLLGDGQLTIKPAPSPQ